MPERGDMTRRADGNIEIKWRSGVSRAALLSRACLLADIRACMAEHEMLEVDTALLSATAPSERALDCMAVADGGFLVPSPEHRLKRLLAEGIGDCYQLGHVFRAGEHGRWHRPEFTMLEWYRIGDNLDDAMGLLDALFAALGAPPIRKRISYRQAFADVLDIDPLAANAATLAACAEARGVAPGAADTADRVFWLDLLMSTCVQPSLGRDGPVALTHFPVDDAVLVAANPQQPCCALRFECVWQGVELANGAVELTDTTLAGERMQREQTARSHLGLTAPPLDELLLAAMAHGLPECAGVALGVDRLFALLRGESAIAPVVPFAAD